MTQKGGCLGDLAGRKDQLERVDLNTFLNQLDPQKRLLLYRIGMLQGKLGAVFEQEGLVQKRAKRQKNNSKIL